MYATIDLKDVQDVKVMLGDAGFVFPVSPVAASTTFARILARNQEGGVQVEFEEAHRVLLQEGGGRKLAMACHGQGPLD